MKIAIRVDPKSSPNQVGELLRSLFFDAQYGCYKSFDWAEDMAKTFSAGIRLNKLSLTKNDTLILFTTGNDITFACETVFRSIIRVINRKIISGFIDDNNNFWEEAEELILITLDSLN